MYSVVKWPTQGAHDVIYSFVRCFFRRSSDRHHRSVRPEFHAARKQSGFRGRDAVLFATYPRKERKINANARARARIRYKSLLRALANERTHFVIVITLSCWYGTSKTIKDAFSSNTISKHSHHFPIFLRIAKRNHRHVEKSLLHLSGKQLRHQGPFDSKRELAIGLVRGRQFFCRDNDKLTNLYYDGKTRQWPRTYKISRRVSLWRKQKNGIILSRPKISWHLARCENGPCKHSDYLLSQWLSIGVIDDSIDRR